MKRNHQQKEGQIIFLSTDGIWEARNQQGEMFGRERIFDNKGFSNEHRRG